MATNRSLRHLISGATLLATLGSGISGATLLATLGSGMPAVASSDATDLPELHPNLARGRSTSQSFTGEGFFAIDLFNGNLTLDLPVGLRYPIDDKLSYHFNLRYNSNVWDFRDDAGTAKALPMAASNAGLGFDLSFGRLLAPGGLTNPTNRWIYITADGGHHAFYSDLHWNTPDVNDAGDAFQYSRDGSYLRLQHVSTSEARVAFPDGRLQQLELRGDFWMPTRISHEGSDGWIDIAYAADDLSWTVTDSTGRQHTVVFTADPNDPAHKLVTRIDLTAFAGTVASYGLTYATETIDRHCEDDRGGSETLSFLTSLTDPLSQVRDFSYHGVGAACAARGRLSTADHDAGGTFAWTYDEYEFPSTDCSVVAPSYLLSNGGVATRQNRGPDGSVVGAWSYSPVNHADGSKIDPSSCDFTHRATTVATPSSDRFVHHFSLAATASLDGQPADYALPFTRALPDATGAGLAHEVYACAGGACQRLRATYQDWDADRTCAHLGDDCFDQNRRLKRRRTVYLDDALDNGSERFDAVDYSDFDGLGHYRTALETGNFVGDEYFETVVAFNPGHGSYPGGFVPPATAAPWFTASVAARSVRQGSAGTWRHVQYCMLQGGRVARLRTLAGDTPGATDLIEETTWLGGIPVEERAFGGDVQALPTGNDLCALTLPAPQYRTRLAFEHGALALREPLDGAGQSFLARSVDRSIDANTGLVAVQRDVAGIATHFEYDPLGRLVYSKPEPGHGPWIRHVYRAPTGGTRWQDGLRKTSLWQPNGGGATLKKETEWRDAFGQMAANEIDLPDNRGTLNARSRMLQKTDAEGRLVWKTPRFQPEDGVAAPTHYEAHDPFGRVRRIVSPDGHETTMVHRGARWSETTRSNGRAFTGAVCLEEDGTTTTIKDTRGRTRSSLSSRSKPLPGLEVESVVTYDVAGKTTSHIRSTTIGQTTQTGSQIHAWDRRGLPVKTISADHLGSVIVRHDYGDFDARRRHRWERYVDASRPYPGLETARSYDPAGRLITIAEAGNPNRIWKTFVYATDNDAGPPIDARRGRLVAAERHNYVANNRHFVVRDTYVYRGPGGKASEATVDVLELGSSLKRYRTTVGYDALGDINAVDYPTCEVCAPGEPTLARSVGQSRDRGFLVALDGELDGVAQSWLDDIFYAPSLQPDEVVHANGVRDLYHRDPNHLPRISRIEVQGAAVTFDSGTFVYDGRGDVCGVGDQSRVADWPELPAQLPATPCLDAMVSDPFGQVSGAVENPQCRFEDVEPVSLFDAQDRLVAMFDYSARKEVYDPATGDYVWIQDPASWTHTWRLHGVGGPLLRTVEDGYLDNGWRRTVDTVHGLGTTAHVHSIAGASAPTTRHVHPAGGITTDPQGQPHYPGQP